MPDEPEPTEEQLEARLQKLLGEAETASDAEFDDIELKLRGYEDKLAAQKGERKDKDALFDAEFEERLRKLHDKADRAKSTREGEKREKARNHAAELSSSKGLGVGLSIAYTITGLPLLGAVIGYFLDQAFNTHQWVGICVLIGAAGGLVMAFLMMKGADQQK